MERAGRARVTRELSPHPIAAPPVAIAPGRPVVRAAINDYRAPWRHELAPARLEPDTGPLESGTRRWRGEAVRL
jgi:hypothetical protein